MVVSVGEYGRPDVYSVIHFIYGFLGFLGLVVLGGCVGAAYAFINLATFFLYQRYDPGIPVREYAEYAAGWAGGLIAYILYNMP